MSRASLAVVASRRAEPGSGDAWRRWLHDPALAALARATCTALRAARSAPLPATPEEHA
jgi:hypothetical protein